MKKIFSLMLLSLTSVMFVTVAYAQFGANVGISPSSKNESMNYEAKPGTAVDDSFMVENIGTKVGNFEIYVVDLDEAKKVEKDYTPPKLQAETQTGIGLWTRVSERYVTLDPGERKVITFSIVIPSDTPKEKVYRGSIIATLAPVVADQKTKVMASDATGGNITISSNVATNMSVKVTDNPTVLLAAETANDVPVNETNRVPLYLFLAAILIISIGYFFYRKK